MYADKRETVPGNLCIRLGGTELWTATARIAIEDLDLCTFLLRAMLLEGSDGLFYVHMDSFSHPDLGSPPRSWR